MLIIETESGGEWTRRRFILKEQTTPMTNVISALTARTQFGQILRRVKQKNERFLVGRRGEPQAIIIGIDDYINTFAPTPAWLKAIGAEAKRKGLNKVTTRQIDAEITTVRRERRRNTPLNIPAK
jgi:prevent-host-death family protein